MSNHESSGMPLDFDALYRGESPGEGIPPMLTPPWDTQAPKDNVITWQAQGLIHGDVLDVGCGLGDNAIYLAQHGHPVTGLDISPAALTAAGGRAADAGVHVTFAVADATTLDGYADAFDTVIDSGMFHCLPDDDKRRYLVALHRATRAGATLLLSCFSEANHPPEADRPRPMVSEPALREFLGRAGWDIESLHPVSVYREGWGAEMGFWYVQAQRLA